MTKLDQAQRAQHLEELRVQRDRAQIALGELRSQLARKYDALAGRVAALPEIQSALPTDAALVAWIDINPTVPTPPIPTASTGASSFAPRGRRPGSDSGEPARTTNGPMSIPG